MHTKS